MDVQKTFRNHPTTKKSKSGGLWTRGLMVLALTVLVVSLVVVSVLYWQTKNQFNVMQQHTQTNDDEKTKQIIVALEQLMLLPDEQPTVATVTDATKLKQGNPTFYKNVQNGHALVVFSDKAILFDPDNKKIINIAPIFQQPVDTEVSKDDQNQDN